MGDRIRKAVCADDRWYPSSAAKLRAEVEGYIRDAVRLERDGEVVGLISPHAGYFFSGHVAGAAFAQVRGETYETVVLVGPDHRGVAFGRLVFPDYDAWNTPLGDVPVDRELIDAIGNGVSLQLVDLKKDSEHSLEVQLPFMQVALGGDFALAPIMMGDTSKRTCEMLGAAIASAVKDKGRSTLLVASTDLSHFRSYDDAARIDESTLDCIVGFDPAQLCGELESGEASACGGGPVAVIMYAAKELGAGKAVLVKYANSGDVWQDKRQVVGYGAVMFVR